ncbi:MAG: flagellar hook-basal body complex protein FliE [Pseudooceanicola sp.]
MTDTTTLISSNAVRGAYQSSHEIKAKAPSAEFTGEDRASFADMVRQVGADTVQTVREAEALGQAGLSGEADTQAVIEATLELDTTVRMAVSVRDKLVEAYQEIMRMPI